MRAAILVCLLAWPAAEAKAQAPLAAVPPATTTFLTRADAYLSWAGLASSDPRFASDGHLGFDVDLVDYRAGRLNFVADYEGVLGHERRIFDLNHSNYVFEASSSYRLRSVEVAVAFHHESRHLNDRDNPSTIAWNVFDVRATRRFSIRGSTVDAQLEAGRVLQHTYVDYVWTSDLRLALRRPVNARLGVYASANGGLIGVNRTLERERQCGARLEAGVRINGDRGAATAEDARGLELYIGYERRIDAYPLDRHRERWVAFGFRLVSW